MAETDHILELTRRALDEFETLPLSATVRRAFRIAQLLGESEAVWRLQLESVPLGGSRADVVAEARRLWPEDDYEVTRARVSAIVQAYFDDRRLSEPSPLLQKAGVAEGSLCGGSISEIEQRMDQLSQEAAGMGDIEHRFALRSRVSLDFAVMERIRHLVFSLLSRWEREISFADASSRIFDRHRARVDRRLGAIAPELLDQFNAAYRRAVEGDAESRAQALTSCRRIIKALADHLYPPSPEPVVGSDGRQRDLGDNRYVSRLWQYASERLGETSSEAKAFSATLKDLGARLDRIHDLTNKGVHADVSPAEMEFGVIQTFLIAGEFISFEQT